MSRMLLVTMVGWALSAMAHGEIMAPPAQNEIVPPTAAWLETISSLVPDQPTAVPSAPRRVLLFSLATGYQHHVRPHTAASIKILGEKTGAFEVVESDDVEMFTSGRLSEFDAVILNNTCPKPEKRDLFFDVLQDAKRAAELEQNLLDYVAGGNGVVVLHGAATFQCNSQAVSDMFGGSFDFHPRRQRVTLDLVEPDHPLVAGFAGQSFVHNDEPYLFKNAYAKKNFRPLLKMDVSKLDEETHADSRVTADVRYVSWIKRHGEGRVFFCSPSHQPESFETEAMLRFLLDGVQYAVGDLPCDDSPK